MIDPYALVASMDDQIRKLRKQLYDTPKWRKIKRYHLFEKINTLEEDSDLISHVMMDE